jgi:uncharacterized damage-inducible protein DinB
MRAPLKTQFDALEKSRLALFDGLKKYSDAQLNKQPAPGKWSVVQIMDHLMMSEGASLAYLKKKTLDTSRSKHAGFAGKRRLLTLKLIFYSPLAFNAPSVLDPPAVFTTLLNTDAKWRTLRAETYELLGKLNEEELQKELWLHPMAGKMNIYQMLSFYNIHFERHRKQIERTLAALGG